MTDKNEINFDLISSLFQIKTLNDYCNSPTLNDDITKIQSIINSSSGLTSNKLTDINNELKLIITEFNLLLKNTNTFIVNTKNQFEKTDNKLSTSITSIK